LTVTESYEGHADSTCSSCSSNDRIVATLDGEEITTWWMSWSRLPEKGEKVDVSVGPLWWHPIVERIDTAVFLLLLGLLPLLTAAGLVKATNWPRPRKLRRAPVSS
jgi:hypothetical protein